MSSGNGVVDLAAGDAPPMGEKGTAVDADRVFTDFDRFLVSGGDASARQIDEMLRVDGKAKSLEQVLTLPLRAAPWSLDATAGDQGEAEWVREALTRPSNAGGMSTPIELVLGQATSACLYRRAFFEKVFKIDQDGRVAFDKLAFRPAGTCRPIIDKVKGSFDGYTQYVGNDHPNADSDGRVKIAPDRAFVFVNGQHRRPLEGVSDLETAYQLFEAKQKVRYLWFVFLENQTMPKAVAKDDSNDPRSIAAFANTVAGLKGGGVVGIGKDQDVSPFETSTAAGDAFADAIHFLDTEMSGSVLAGFTDLTAAASNGRGSNALSVDQSNFFLQSRQGVLTELGAALTGFAVADLCRWNFGIGAAVPKFNFGPLVPEHAEKAFEMLQELAGQERPLVPQDFIDQLIERVAAYLGLDIDRVAQAIRERQQQVPGTPAEKFAAGIEAGQQLVAEARAAQTV